MTKAYLYFARRFIERIINMLLSWSGLFLTFFCLSLIDVVVTEAAQQHRCNFSRSPSERKNFSKIPVISFFIFVYVVYRNYTIASKRKKLVGAFFIVFKDCSFNVFFLPTFTRPSPRRKNRSYIRTYVPKSMNKMIKVYVRTNSNLI